MGNVPLFPVHNPNATPGAPELKQAIREPRPYMCLDPLPKYFQDPEFLAKLANSKGPLLRSAMEPEVKPEVDVDTQPDEPTGPAFTIEAILSKRTKQKTLEYLVQWEDCPEEASTWEPAEHLKPFPELVEEFEREWLAKRQETKRKNAPPKAGPGRGWNSRKRAAKTAREAKRRKLEEKRAHVEEPPPVEEVFRFQPLY